MSWWICVCVCVFFFFFASPEKCYDNALIRPWFNLSKSLRSIICQSSYHQHHVIWDTDNFTQSTPKQLKGHDLLYQNCFSRWRPIVLFWQYLFSDCCLCVCVFCHELYQINTHCGSHMCVVTAKLLSSFWLCVVYTGSCLQNLLLACNCQF